MLQAQTAKFWPGVRPSGRQITSGSAQAGGILLRFREAFRHGADGRRGRTTMTATDSQPITIKKYANRRLYNTGTSSYVTLEDLAGMVKRGEDFVVFDAKSGDEITRSVLAQIIFEQEGKNGQSLLPDHLPAPAHPLLWRQHADAGPELSRIHHRSPHQRPAQDARADGGRDGQRAVTRPGLAQAAVRPDGGDHAHQHAAVLARR